MSSNVLPSYIGLKWKRKRSPNWDTIVQPAVSGFETRIALRPQPKWSWELGYAYLGSGVLNGQTNTDFQNLAGFYNGVNGMFNTFLFTEPDDSTVSGQQFGTGDGTNLSFQLVRTMGGFIETILAPHTVSAVYVDGVSVDGANWSVSLWGTANPGIVTFGSGHAPANGKAVTADFSYYWPVRFDSDNYEFSNDMNKVWSMDKITFTQVFN